MENEPVGRAILSPLDTVMIVDMDWTASHSHPEISVWTVTSKTYEMPASYYLFPPSVCSCLKIPALKNLQRKFIGPQAFVLFAILYAYLTECSFSVLSKIAFIFPTQKLSASSATALALTYLCGICG